MRPDAYYARLERLGTREVRVDRKKLEQDIKSYLKGGGKIEQVPTGVSAFDDILNPPEKKNKDEGWTTIGVAISETSITSKVKPLKE